MLRASRTPLRPRPITYSDFASLTPIPLPNPWLSDTRPPLQPREVRIHRTFCTLATYRLCSPAKIPPERACEPHSLSGANWVSTAAYPPRDHGSSPSDRSHAIIQRFAIASTSAREIRAGPLPRAWLVFVAGPSAARRGVSPPHSSVLRCRPYAPIGTAVQCSCYLFSPERASN